MNLPINLSHAIAEKISKISRAQLTQATADLTERYRSPERDQLHTFMINDYHRLAYLTTRLPATYAVVKKVLEICSRQIPDFSPQSFIDIGSGPGTASWAVANVFPQIQSMTLYEKDEAWLRIGKSMMEQAENAAIKNAVWKQMDLAINRDFDVSDLAVLSYVVGELDLESMKMLIDSAWKLTSQILVIIEPGTPHGFERIRLLRQHLIASGAFIVAPCTHHGKCPMEGNDWCHFSVRLERSSSHMAAKEATMGYEDEKFSYLIVSKTKVPLPQARILRHPQRHSGHTEFVLCTTEGLEKRTISRRSKELYKQSKKLDWGDAF